MHPSMATKVIYPGTFDPITNGHSDIAARAAGLFDHVIVAIAAGRGKVPLFTLEERKKLAEVVLGHIKNVSICTFDCLLAEFAKRCDATAVVRGLRAVSDFEYELQLAGMNRPLMPNIETVFLPTSSKYTYISSSIVREIASFGGNVEYFVHPKVMDALYQKMRYHSKTTD